MVLIEAEIFVFEDVQAEVLTEEGTARDPKAM
jgi:hypothetical protein